MTAFTSLNWIDVNPSQPNWKLQLALSNPWEKPKSRLVGQLQVRSSAMEAIEAPVPDVPPAPATPSNMQYKPMGGFLRSLELFSTDVPLLCKENWKSWPCLEFALYWTNTRLPFSLKTPWKMHPEKCRSKNLLKKATCGHLILELCSNLSGQHPLLRHCPLRLHNAAFYELPNLDMLWLRSVLGLGPTCHAQLMVLLWDTSTAPSTSCSCDHVLR